MRSVEEVLLEGIRAGQFGGESKPHGDHAMGFVSFLDDPAVSFRGHVVDIGSGAGLPALVLADAFPETSWTLIERRQGRTELLNRATRRLEMQDRINVVTADVTVAARSSLRGGADWVTARSFGPPGDTAECAAPFLRVGGSLVVSEPFDGVIEQRWPDAGLAHVGLAFAEEWTTDAGRYARFVQFEEAAAHVPRKGARKKLLF